MNKLVSWVAFTSGMLVALAGVAPVQATNLQVSPVDWSGNNSQTIARYVNKCGYVPTSRLVNGRRIITKTYVCRKVWV